MGKYKTLWDLHSGSAVKLHDMVKDNVKAGRPHNFMTHVRSSEDFKNQEVDPNYHPSDFNALPSGCVEWKPETIAQFLARRSGVDFCNDDCEIYQRADTVPTGVRRISVVCGDATLASTYTCVESLLSGDSVELVLLDPPFGLGKHGASESWDTADQKWKPTKDILGYLQEVPLRSTFCLAIYCQVEDIGRWLDALRPGTPKIGEARGHVVVSMGKDKTPQMLPGSQSRGVVVYVLVVKFGNGNEAVAVEESPLGARFQYSFAPPRKASKYGRPEVDAVLYNRADPVNPTQKSIEETRLLIRTLAPRGGSVLSMCNGTGTALIAAAIEGRHAVGVDLSPRQCSHARRRLRVFVSREDRLTRALYGHLLPTQLETLMLKADAIRGDVPDLQVRRPDVDCVATCRARQVGSPSLCGGSWC